MENQKTNELPLASAITIQKLSGAECEVYLLHDANTRALIQVCSDYQSMSENLARFFGVEL